MRKSVKVVILATVLLVAVTLVALAQAPVPNLQDPKYQSKGEQDRTYAFPGTGEMISYHIYVPMNWDKNTKLPLVIATHGAGQASSAPFMRPMAMPTLAQTAEARGYIVAAVTGYHTAQDTGWDAATGQGGWNNPYKMVGATRGGGGAAGAGGGGGGRGGRGGGAGAPAGAPAAVGAGAPVATGAAPTGAPAAGAPGAGAPAAGARGAGGAGGRGGAAAAPATPEDLLRAEQDVLYVTDLMTKEYNVDTNRIYLMGNSSGGGAVWAYSMKYPERWTAIAPSAAPLADGQDIPFAKLKNVPVLYIHGDADTTMDYNAGKAAIDRAKAAGVNATFLGVAGGQHTDAWAQPEIIKQIFDFFDAHKTKLK